MQSLDLGLRAFYRRIGDGIGLLYRSVAPLLRGPLGALRPILLRLRGGEQGAVLLGGLLHVGLALLDELGGALEGRRLAHLAGGDLLLGLGLAFDFRAFQLRGRRRAAQLRRRLLGRVCRFNSSFLALDGGLFGAFRI